MTNLKPFDLEKALAGAKVVTRKGRKVIDMHYFKDTRDEQQLFAFIEGNDFVEKFDDHGKYLTSKDESSWDLFMAPTTKTYWINIYKSTEDKIFSCRILKSLEEVKEEINDSIENFTFIKTISFEIEE